MCNHLCAKCTILMFVHFFHKKVNFHMVCSMKPWILTKIFIQFSGIHCNWTIEKRTTSTLVSSGTQIGSLL